MPLYRYVAATEDGKKKSGMINADSYEVAKDLLRRQKVLVIKLFEFNQNAKSQVLSQSLLLSFTRDLSQLLKAGLPLFESLLTIEEKYRSSSGHTLFMELCDKVKHGMHLSSALTYYPKTFDQIYLSMVSAAEETGSLPEAFDQLEKLISRQEKLKKQLLSPMLYPCFLFAFCMVVVVALFFFLIPSMQQLFEGRTLHPITQAVLSTSQWLNAHYQGLLTTLIAIGLGMTYFLISAKGKRAVSIVALKVPVLKRILSQGILIRFCRSLSVMLSSGVPMIEALKLSKKTMKHPLYEELVTTAEGRIMQGGKLAEEFGKSPLMPPLVIRMLSIAEETGSLSEMLKHVADIYEDELEKTLSRFTALLQPVTLMFLAFIVGIVVISILLPLTDVGSFLNY